MAASRRPRREPRIRPEPGAVCATLDAWAALAGVPAPVRTVERCRACGRRGLAACPTVASDRQDGRCECEACSGTGRVAVAVELTDPDR